MGIVNYQSKKLGRNLLNIFQSISDFCELIFEMPLQFSSRVKPFNFIDDTILLQLVMCIYFVWMLLVLDYNVCLFITIGF